MQCKQLHTQIKSNNKFFFFFHIPVQMQKNLNSIKQPGYINLYFNLQNAL